MPIPDICMPSHWLTCAASAGSAVTMSDESSMKTLLLSPQSVSAQLRPPLLPLFSALMFNELWFFADIYRIVLTDLFSESHHCLLCVPSLASQCSLPVSEHSFTFRRTLLYERLGQSQTEIYYMEKSFDSFNAKAVQSSGLRVVERCQSNLVCLVVRCLSSSSDSQFLQDSLYNK